MEMIIKKIMKVLGWKKLLKMVWNAIQDDLQKAAQKTETQFDDKAIEIVNEVIQVIVSDDAIEA